MFSTKSPCNNCDKESLPISITPTPLYAVGFLDDVQVYPTATKQELKPQTKKAEGIFATIAHAMVTYASKHQPEVVNWVQNGEAFIVDSCNKDLGSLLTQFFRRKSINTKTCYSMILNQIMTLTHQIHFINRCTIFFISEATQYVRLQKVLKGKVSS